MGQIKNLLNKFLKQKPKFEVGLDIGNSSVKVVQLCSKPNSKLKELVSFDLQRFVGPVNNDVIAAAIKIAMKNANINNPVVNTSVSGQAVIVRYIQMPKMTKEELDKALKLGIGKYIPFGVDEVNSDCQILDDSDKKSKMMRVMLVAVKKNIIKERMDILARAGLKANVIDVDSFAIVNSFQLISQENKGIIAVLDIGADITSTTILKDNVPHFNRDVPIGGSNFTRAIIEEFEMTVEEAEELKHNPQTRYGDLITAIRPVIDALSDEMQLSFNYCESQLGGPVQKIFLTGGMAKFKGIGKVLSGILGVDVEIWDPTRILLVNEALPREKIVETGPLLTVAIGLALRG
ncbi:MAG: type IV pilus assembly protein PilM [Candidatus Omnitrophica bacterium]|nr:type IV pilus assembly protein PilM [Candidatus Omnitrophota bacterium]